MACAAGGGDVGSARLTVDGEEQPADRGAPRRGNGNGVAAGSLRSTEGGRSVSPVVAVHGTTTDNSC
jgi:hypothetical protein